MKNFNIAYWTDLMRCGCGGNVGGNTSIMLDEEKANIFIKVIEPAKETRDMLGYFEDKLPEDISSIICNAIKKDFERVMAYNAICECGIDVFSSDITEEEFKSMTKEQLIDRLLKESESELGEADYKIVDIEIN